MDVLEKNENVSERENTLFDLFCSGKERTH